MALRAAFPRGFFRRRGREYDLRLGPLSFPQNAYLLIGALVVGVGGGVGAVLFRALTAYAGVVAGALTALLAHVLGPFALVASVGIGGALAVWIAVRFAPEARGHGVPEVMAAVALRGGVMRPRVIFVKALASATTLGFGGAAGREGPIIQIGAAIGSVLGQVVHAPVPIVRTLLACGAAAGVSATFNAPLGGALFASEVIVGDFAPRSFVAIIVSSVVGAVIGRAALGNQPSFHATGFALVSPRELGLYALLGVLCAFWATGFVKLLYGCEDLAARVKLPPVAKGFGGFALVGLIGVGVPQILGVGYAVMQHVFDRHVPAARAFGLAVLEPVATSITLAAGGSGGVFGPSLYTGAMLGDAFGRVVHGLFPGWTAAPAAYGLVAMAALFAAAAEAPITAIVIVFEMSDDYGIVLPLMIATAVATALGRRLIGGTIDDLTLYRRGIDWNSLRRPHALADLPAAAAIQRRPFTARGEETVRAVAARLPADADGVAVVFGLRLVGVVAPAGLAEWLSREPDAPIARAALPVPPTLRGEDSMERAAELLADSAVGFVPMLDDAGRLVGVVNRRQVLEAFRAARSG